MRRVILALALLSPAFSQGVPDFVHGDECLFCHRNDIGPGWQKNRHGQTLRQRGDVPELTALPKDATHVLGSREHVRYLKQSGYGKLDLLTRTDPPGWQSGKFNQQCAGCHATAVDPKTLSYRAIGLDCYTCHGVVDLEHTNDTSKIFLSKKRRTDALAITSTCAACHLRGGKSRLNDVPYPVGFIAGQDLFKIYEADLAKADDPALNAGDRHVWKNVREVINAGSQMTCLSCHRVHAATSERHRRVLSGPICLECHNAEGPKKALKPYVVHSSICEY